MTEETHKQLYTLGFAFDSSAEKVVLIRKNRPAFLAGLLNGVGGKIEDGETPIETMVREFREETGVETSALDWIFLGKMSNTHFEVNVYSAFGDFALDAKTMESEEIVVHDVDMNAILENGAANLAWLIPMALASHDRPVRFGVELL